MNLELYDMELIILYLNGIQYVCEVKSTQLSVSLTLYPFSYLACGASEFWLDSQGRLLSVHWYVRRLQLCLAIVLVMKTVMTDLKISLATNAKKKKKMFFIPLEFCSPG